MNPTKTLRLVPEVDLKWTGAEGATLTMPPTAHRAPLTFPSLSPTQRMALAQLATEDGAALEQLVAQAMGAGGPAEVGRVSGLVQRLGQGALLCHRVFLGAERLVTSRPLSLYYRVVDRGPEAAAFALSRFAYLRHAGGKMILEGPLGHAEIELHSPSAMAAIHALIQPRTAATLAEAVPGLTLEAATALLGLLLSAAALVESKGVESTGVESTGVESTGVESTGVESTGAPSPEDADPVRAPWDFHDLLFHSRSRLGRHDRPFGGTYPFKGKLEPLPVVKPPMSAVTVPLFRPDLERLGEADLPFSRVLEARTSRRVQGAPAISAEQLGELLFRAARVRKLAAEAGVSFRPYPGGGALHELEIYPLIHDCAGLEAGLYHYNAEAHHLERLSGLTLGELRDSAHERLQEVRRGDPKLLRVIADETAALATQAHGEVLHLGGAGNIFLMPDFRREALRGIVNMIEDRGPIVGVLERRTEQDGVAITIGNENRTLPDIQTCSLITSRYRVGSASGVVGIIGPTRMRYSWVAALVRFAAHLTEDLVGEKATGGKP